MRSHHVTVTRSAVGLSSLPSKSSNQNNRPVERSICDISSFKAQLSRGVSNPLQLLLPGVGLSWADPFARIWLKKATKMVEVLKTFAFLPKRSAKKYDVRNKCEFQILSIEAMTPEHCTQNLFVQQASENSLLATTHSRPYLPQTGSGGGLRWSTFTLDFVAMFSSRFRSSSCSSPNRMRVCHALT